MRPFQLEQNSQREVWEYEAEKSLGIRGRETNEVLDALADI